MGEKETSKKDNLSTFEGTENSSGTYSKLFRNRLKLSMKNKTTANLVRFGFFQTHRTKFKTQILTLQIKLNRARKMEFQE